MKRWPSLLIIAVLTLVLMGAMGPKRLRTTPTNPQINALGLDASRAFTVTNTRSAGAWGLMMVYIELLDANNSVTALNMVCSASIDDNTTDHTMQDCTLSSGTATCNNLTWVKDPSGITSPKKWVYRVDIEGFEDIECTFTDTGGVAADKLTVDIGFAVKG